MFERENKRASSGALPSWAGAAFIIEAMLLLVFLVGSLAVFTQLFAEAANQSRQSKVLTSAVAAATTEAERFAANPSQAEGTTEINGLSVVCDVSETSHNGGTLYRADISVFENVNDNPVYTISTSSYEGEVNR